MTNNDARRTSVTTNGGATDASRQAQVTCIYCGDKQTHPVCAACFERGCHWQDCPHGSKCGHVQPPQNAPLPKEG